jgi:hypothetical protein
MIKDHPGQFGESDVYPSRAAGYGSDGLMAMAGTLAERAEADIADRRTSGRIAGPDAEALKLSLRTAEIYTRLAHVAAIREQTEALQEMHAGITEGLSRISEVIEGV